MTPSEFQKFLNQKREAFFSKYPNPSKKGARGFWKQARQHAANAKEDNDWMPETFEQAVAKINQYLEA